MNFFCYYAGLHAGRVEVVTETKKYRLWATPEGVYNIIVGLWLIYVKQLGKQEVKQEAIQDNKYKRILKSWNSFICLLYACVLIFDCVQSIVSSPGGSKIKSTDLCH